MSLANKYPAGWFVTDQYGGSIVADWARANCIECKAPAKVHYFFESRCQACSDRFKAKLHAENVAKWHRELERQRRHVCGKDKPDAAEFCQECCEHEFDTSEGGMCLNCDKDGYE